MRVLIVEDDPEALRMLRTLFASWGYTVDTASSGLAALVSVAAACPQIIVSDLIMPGMSGLELLHALRTQGCTMFFILLTGYGTVPRGVAAIEEGADEVLLKPIDTELLRTTLEHRGLWIHSEEMQQ